jgi:hypothetical protein
MYGFTREDYIDLESLRNRLRRMSDAELLRFGKAAAYMASPHLPHYPRERSSA